jgi:hypothetical protein
MEFVTYDTGKRKILSFHGLLTDMTYGDKIIPREVLMRTIVLLLAIAIATQALGAERAYREWNPNSSGSFHIDNKGFDKKQTQNIGPLVNRAHEIMDGNNCYKESCSELKEISWKLQTFWVNADYEDRKRIDDVRTATEKKCGRI